MDETAHSSKRSEQPIVTPNESVLNNTIVTGNNKKRISFYNA